MNEPRTYRIVTASETVDLFRTAETAGRSADENAIGNLVEYSLHHDGLHLTLEYVEADCSTAIAEACSGEARPLVDPDSLAADAMHCGPAVAAAPELERAAS